MKALRVMIVEDDALVAILLAEFLVEMGHEVCATEATQTGAVAAAARTKPDLMIVDARLSQGSGVSAMAEILQSGFVPHIFVSGDTLSGQSISLAAVVIQKPYFEPDIVRAIGRALAAGSAGV